MRSIRLSANIVVSNLPEDLTAGDLAELFDEFGLVLTARIHRPKEEPVHAPRGWVDLAPANSVERAIAALDGRVVRMHKLKVRKAPAPAASRKAARPASPPAIRRNEPGRSYAPPKSAAEG